MTKSTHHYELIDRNAVNAAWNGTPTKLLVNQNVVMPQTPNGSTIFAATNQATLNNAGSISLTSGGGAPTFVNVPALTSNPTVQTNNWNANNLSVTNLSIQNDTPILVQAVGPGIPGITPAALTASTPVSLQPGNCASGATAPQYNRLAIQVTGPTLGVVGLIGGPVDSQGNNGYVISVNDTQNSGPGTGIPAPQGYYATTTSNSYSFPFNWKGASLFVANLSPGTAQAVSVTLQTL